MACMPPGLAQLGGPQVDTSATGSHPARLYSLRIVRPLAAQLRACRVRARQQARASARAARRAARLRAPLRPRRAGGHRGRRAPAVSPGRGGARAGRRRQGRPRRAVGGARPRGPPAGVRARCRVAPVPTLARTPCMRTRKLSHKGVFERALGAQVGRGDEGVVECTPHYSYVSGLKCGHSCSWRSNVLHATHAGCAGRCLMRFGSTSRTLRRMIGVSNGVHVCWINRNRVCKVLPPTQWDRRNSSPQHDGVAMFPCLR